MRYLLLFVGLMAACATDTSETPLEDACGAASLSEFVGQERSALAARTFPDSTRFIAPDTAITMDYRAERLNFDLDGADVIIRIWCG